MTAAVTTNPAVVPSQKCRRVLPKASAIAKLRVAANTPTETRKPGKDRIAPELARNPSSKSFDTGKPVAMPTTMTMRMLSSSMRPSV